MHEARTANQTVERMAGPPRRLRIRELLEGQPSLTFAVGHFYGMRKFIMKASKFVVMLLLCTVVSTLIWEWFVAGTIYHCSDPGFLEFLSPGDWAHIRYGDTLRDGWSTTGLWCLWWLFVIGSVVASLTLAVFPWRFRTSHEQVAHNMAEPSV